MNTTQTVDSAHKLAAWKILTPEAATRYCAGDMSATDQAGHDAIEREVIESAQSENTMPKISEKEYAKLERTITKLLKELKKQIGDEYRANEEDETPGMCVTIGATPQEDGSLSWSYQTGDNSYTGGAYGHAHWGVGSLYRQSKSAEVAKDIVNEIADSIEQH